MHHTQPPRIMIVDDVKTNIDILIDILAKDYQISVALDGETALEDIVADPPDLVLLDIMMPGIDGYAVCEQLKADPKTTHIPIIFITAMDQESDEVLGLGMGAIDYITKPITRSVVRMRVKNHLYQKLERDRLKLRESLTGAYQRRYLLQVLEDLREQPEETTSLALLVIELDAISKIRQQQGIGIADELIAKLAELMQALIQPDDLLAYHPNEGFALLLRRQQTEQIQAVAKKICDGLSTYLFKTADQVIYSTSSIGLAFYTPDEDPVALLENAAFACQQASQQGGNRIQTYAAPVEATTASPVKPSLSRQVKNAINQKDYTAYFQPLLDLRHDRRPRYEIQLQLHLEQEQSCFMRQLRPKMRNPQMLVLLDRLLLLFALKTAGQQQTQGLNTIFWLQLDVGSLIHPHQLDWLKGQQERFSLKTIPFVLEISRQQAEEQLPALQAFAQQSRLLGIELAISDFAQPLGATFLLDQLQPEWVRLSEQLLPTPISDNPEQPAPASGELDEAIQALTEKGVRALASPVNSSAVLTSLWYSGVQLVQGDWVHPASRQMDFDFSL